MPRAPTFHGIPAKCPHCQNDVYVSCHKCGKRTAAIQVHGHNQPNQEVWNGRLRHYTCKEGFKPQPTVIVYYRQQW